MRILLSELIPSQSFSSALPGGGVVYNDLPGHDQKPPPGQIQSMGLTLFIIVVVNKRIKTLFNETIFKILAAIQI